jgi:hypothetical protein
LVCYLLIAPGSEWKLFGHDDALVEKNALYRVHDRILKHMRKLFDHLTDKWKDLFGATSAVLLYDLTSTSFEIDEPDHGLTKKPFS